MRKLVIAAAALSLTNAVDLSAPAEPGSRKRGKDKAFKREPHAASIAKPKSESLKRMLRKAKARPA